MGGFGQGGGQVGGVRVDGNGELKVRGRGRVGGGVGLGVRVDVNGEVKFL